MLKLVIFDVQLYNKGSGFLNIVWVGVKRLQLTPGLHKHPCYSTIHKVSLWGPTSLRCKLHSERRSSLEMEIYTLKPAITAGDKLDKCNFE